MTATWIGPILRGFVALRKSCQLAAGIGILVFGACLMGACGREQENPQGAPVAAPSDRDHARQQIEEVSNARARMDMVLEILDSGPPALTDGAVLAAMSEIPRHDFVDSSARQIAYDNSPVPIGRGQVTSKPYLVALATQLLELTGREHVLEIGTGTGYHGALLSRLAARVTTLEIDPELAERARTLLARHGRGGVKVICADGAQGWAAGGPYDAILVSAGLVSLDPALTDQLVAGGRLVAPLGPVGAQQLTLVIKHRDRLEHRPILAVRYTLLR